MRFGKAPFTRREIAHRKTLLPFIAGRKRRQARGIPIHRRAEKAAATERGGKENGRKEDGRRVTEKSVPGIPRGTRHSGSPKNGEMADCRQGKAGGRAKTVGEHSRTLIIANLRLD